LGVFGGLGRGASRPRHGGGQSRALQKGDHGYSKAYDWIKGFHEGNSKIADNWVCFSYKGSQSYGGFAAHLLTPTRSEATPEEKPTIRR